MSSTKDRFEDHLAQVEQAVAELESGNLPLEESIRRYELGVKALKECYSILDQAEKKIQQLVRDESGKLDVQPLEPGKDEPEPTAKPGPRRPAAKNEDETPF